LDRAKVRLGAAAFALTWIEADVASDWSLKSMDIWHDRAVFHFLTEAGDRLRYRQHLLSTLKPTGSAIVATFAPDGPATCSGLPVMRYSAQTLSRELGDEFALVETLLHEHLTPWGTSQSFQYSRFVRIQ
jgi:trans-aconitate methyltransferase